MVKRTRIEPILFQCTRCKKKYFSFQESLLCLECTKEKEKSDVGNRSVKLTNLDVQGTSRELDQMRVLRVPKKN